jgi:hypothetical protein
MDKKYIIKRIENFYKKPESVRGAKHMLLLGFDGDGDTILNALRECRDIIENVTETIKYDYIGQRSFIEFEVEFQEGIAYDKTDNNRYHMVAPDGKQWIDLDIEDLTTFPKDFFSNENIELETVSGAKTWVFTNHKRFDIIEQLLMGRKYRYRLKELKRIRITRDIIKKYKLPVTEVIREKADNTMPHSGLLENVFILDGHDVEILDK